MMLQFPHHMPLFIATLCISLASSVGFQPPSNAMILEGRVSVDQQVQEQAPEPGIVGINFDIRRDASPVIAEVYPDTPAIKAGLKPGDEVIAINTKATRGLSIYQVDEAISNKPGDEITFLVNRNGQIFPVKLTVESLSNVRSPHIRSLYADMSPY